MNNDVVEYGRIWAICLKLANEALNWKGFMAYGILAYGVMAYSVVIIMRWMNWKGI